jgi:O-antigen/teichoic acid export membrane protein
MGVVKRQSFKRSIVAYASVVIGVVSMLFVYPLALERYGEAQFYISLAGLLAPVVGLGVQTLSVRFYPHFRQAERGDHGYLGLLLLAAAGAIAIFGFLAWWWGDYLLWGLEQLQFDVSLIERSLGLVAVLTVCHVLLNLFSSYSSNAHRVVIPELLWNTGTKLGLPLLILLFHYELIRLWGFGVGLASLFVLIVLAMGWYLRHLGLWHLKVDWSRLDRPLLRSMGVYALFGMLTVIGSTLAFRIDNLMVTSLLDAERNGVYNIALMMTNTILIPYNAIMAIVAPIIADKWARNEKAAIADLYQRSALNLLLVGFFLLALLYLSLDDILQLSPRLAVLQEVKPIVLFLGIAKLIDMTTGVNSQIIAYSQHYRFNLYVVLVLGALTVLLNYWLIPDYGLAGAALATLLSLSLYNLLKYLFIWWQFRMHAFSGATLKVLAVGAAASGLVSQLPASPWVIVNLLLIGLTFSTLFWGPVLYWRLSPDLSDWLATARSKALHWFRQSRFK